MATRSKPWLCLRLKMKGGTMVHTNHNDDAARRSLGVSLSMPVPVDAHVTDTERAAQVKGPVLGRIWGCLEQRSVYLSPRSRWSLRRAIEASALEGWQPTTQSIADLMVFLNGQLTLEQYTARVTQHAAMQRGGRVTSLGPRLANTKGASDNRSRRSACTPRAAGPQCHSQQRRVLPSGSQLHFKSCVKLHSRDSFHLP
jgi:hypothetical protein